MENEFRITINEIDQTQFLQSLLYVAKSKDMLTSAEVNRIQNELFGVIDHECKKGTFGPVLNLQLERVEQLLASICYQISVYLKENEDIAKQVQMLKEIPMIQLFEQGHQLTLQVLDQCKETYQTLEAKHFPFKNDAYEETFTKGIPEFFNRYDVNAKAHELPGFFDYPLYLELTEHLGILYVKEYLEQLKLEESFCQMFSDRDIVGLLNGYSKDSKHLVFNIYELVFANVIGNLLLGSDHQKLYTLTLSENDCEVLKKQIAAEGLLQLTDEISTKMKIFLEGSPVKDENKLKAFICDSIPVIASRCHTCIQNGTMHNIFVVKDMDYCMNENHYKDENRLPKEKLTSIITNLKQCKNTSDKLLLIRTEITNMDDLMTVLSECVYGEEARELFSQLEDQELALLMAKVLSESEAMDCYNFDGRISWHMELIMTIRGMEEKRQNAINKLVGKIQSSL